MRNKRNISIIGVGLLGLGAYLLRRQILGRLMKLQPPKYGVRVERGLRIPMSDNTILLADLYKPKSSRLCPTILIRTPYGRGGTVGPTGLLHDFIAQRFAERGYNVFVQDVRGTFSSDGEFDPFIHEADDGHATLAWIEKQNWFNGLVGMWGPSYLGYVQWAIAGGGPLYLKAIVPMITGANLTHSGLRDGALTLDTVLRWIIQIDAMDRKKYLANLLGLQRIRPKTIDKIINQHTNHLPLSEIDRQIVGKDVPFLHEWMEHLDPEDPFWERYDPTKTFSNVTASAHLIGGWYDIFLRETLEDYALLKESGHSPFLTIGPWHHFHGECMIEGIRQGLIWFDVLLKGDRRKLREKPVRLYVSGDGGWREFDSWPPKAKNVQFFLHQSDGNRRNPGYGLAPELPENPLPPDTYIYNPEDPTPSIGGAEMSLNAGPVDNRKLEARPDVMTFTSRQLENTIEVIGYVRLKLYVGSSLENTDFYARLLDVNPDGRSINLCDGLLRIKPGTGELQLDGSRLIEIDMWATANRFQSGHRIRLLIASGAHPRWSRNLGTGDPVQTGTRMVSAEQTIFHDSEHPSALILPVLAS
ncbi:MAG: CocE/NonD family hydrolase [Chloroflexota bacterium]|nr:CocE/NonD family hydrolase [Chloroflexota bacterium]